MMDNPQRERRLVIDVDEEAEWMNTQASVADNIQVEKISGKGKAVMVDDEEDKQFWSEVASQATVVEEAFQDLNIQLTNVDDPELKFMSEEEDDDNELMEFLKNFTDSIHVSDDEGVTTKDNSVTYAAGNTRIGDEVVMKDNQIDNLMKLKFVNNCFISQTVGDSDNENSYEEDHFEDLVELDDEGNGLKDNDQANETSLYDQLYAEELQNVELEELFSDDDEVPETLDLSKIEVGQEFADKHAFNRHLRWFCVKNGFQFKLKKSDHVRIMAVCRFEPEYNCPFIVYAKQLPNEKTFKVRGVNMNHNCVGDLYGRNRSTDPNFVAEHVLEKMKTSHGDEVPKAAGIAEEFQMAGRTNPGSIATYSFGEVDHCFESMTLSFAAPMRGFLDAGRPIIGLDACHLRSRKRIN